MRTLLVASNGGHLSELHDLSQRLVPASDSVVWVTFDNAQSRGLLAGEEVVLVPFVGPRDSRGLARNLVPAHQVLRDTAVERVVSTGAALALAFLPPAHRMGLSCHYIESAARTDGPSFTGHVLRLLGSGSLYSQHRQWAGPRWHYRGSVFDGLEPAPAREPAPLRRVVVTLGTSPFPFTRLVRRLLQVLPPQVQVLWQVGPTPVGPLPGRVVTSLPHEDLVAEMRAADVVVSHAGVGSALTALSVGRCPVLVPRRLAHREHVDDHQLQIARALATRELAVPADADRLDLGHLELAASAATRSVDRPPAFPLVQEPRRRRVPLLVAEPVPAPYGAPRGTRAAAAPGSALPELR